VDVIGQKVLAIDSLFEAYSWCRILVFEFSAIIIQKKAPAGYGRRSPICSASFLYFASQN